jgi:hypothetical protein
MYDNNLYFARKQRKDKGKKRGKNRKRRRRPGFAIGAAYTDASGRRKFIGNKAGNKKFIANEGVRAAKGIAALGIAGAGILYAGDKRLRRDLNHSLAMGYNSLVKSKSYGRLKRALSPKTYKNAFGVVSSKSAQKKYPNQIKSLEDIYNGPDAVK